MKDNIIQLSPKGIPTPRYHAQRIRQDRDPDLFVTMVNNHPGHIARAKAKRDRIIEAARKQAEADRLAHEDAERLTLALGQLSIGSILALTVTAALAL